MILYQCEKSAGMYNSFSYEMTWDYCISIIAFLINEVESWSGPNKSTQETTSPRFPPITNPRRLGRFVFYCRL